MMQPEKAKPFMLEAFTAATTRRDQQFIPFLRPKAPSEPMPVIEPSPTAEEDTRRVFEEAYAEGEKAGFEMGMKKVEPLVERLNRYLSELEQYERDLAQKAEKMAFELAIAFTESLVLKECSEHEDTILRMIKKALEICEQKGKKIIRIRPEDSRFIEKETTGWTIVSDDTLKEPGFFIETDFGEVDGRVSVQLEELRREFLSPKDGACSFRNCEDNIQCT